MKNGGNALFTMSYYGSQMVVENQRHGRGEGKVLEAAALCCRRTRAKGIRSTPYRLPASDTGGSGNLSSTSFEKARTNRLREAWSARRCWKQRQPSCRLTRRD